MRIWFDRVAISSWWWTDFDDNSFRPSPRAFDSIHLPKASASADRLRSRWTRFTLALSCSCMRSNVVSCFTRIWDSDLNSSLAWNQSKSNADHFRLHRVLPNATHSLDSPDEMSRRYCTNLPSSPRTSNQSMVESWKNYIRDGVHPCLDPVPLLIAQIVTIIQLLKAHIGRLNETTRMINTVRRPRAKVRMNDVFTASAVSRRSSRIHRCSIARDDRSLSF